MDPEIVRIERKIFSTFGEVAEAIGYSALHGQIIAVLVVKGKPMSLQEIARETGYSASMISLSLELLEVLGVVKKVKKIGDRKLYVELSGDLLESLKSAIIMKLSKSINSSLAEFEEGRKSLEAIQGEESTRVVKTIGALEDQIKRLKKYVDILAQARLP